MIFLGDLACPKEKIEEFNSSINELDILSGQTVILNLEAVFLSNQRIKKETLYNCETVLASLQNKAKRVIVSLANNHMYDYPEMILPTKSYLEAKGIGVFGLYDERKEIRPFEFEENGKSYALFGHCWDLYTKTNPNRENNVRIVDCSYKTFYETVKRYIVSNPDRKVFCFMHWNYDLEIMPFPMHVRFSHELIDLGAEGIIGSHSHVTHSVEIYKNKPIAYCLGNFYLPSGIYFDGKLKYPEASKITYGIKIKDGLTKVLRFETDTKVPLKYIGEISQEECRDINTADSKEYTRKFRKYRVKKILVPIFNHYSGIGYEFKKVWAIMRVKAIKQLMKIYKPLK